MITGMTEPPTLTCSESFSPSSTFDLLVWCVGPLGTAMRVSECFMQTAICNIRSTESTGALARAARNHKLNETPPDSPFFARAVGHGTHPVTLYSV